MSTDAKSDAGTTVLALLAYQNLCIAESLFGRNSPEPELAERVPVGRLSAEALTRFTRMCDAIPGGQQAAITAMKQIASPIDEFLAVTSPRVRGEQLLRLLFVSCVDVELVARVRPDQISEATSEAIAADAGLWRAVDYASSGVLSAMSANVRAGDELSAYGRRLLGEAAVVGQRLLVRKEGLRLAFTGQADEDLIASTEVLDGLLAAVASRLAHLGLSV